MSDFDDIFGYGPEDVEFYDDNQDSFNSSLYEMADISSEYNSNVFGNAKLKNGIVVKVYEKDDEANLSKKFPEYDVLVVEQKETHTVEPVLYKHCTWPDIFGGRADFFEYKLRPVKINEAKDKGKTPISTTFKDQFGSMVLLLCLDGATDKGVIVGGVPHPGRTTNLSKENGIHLEGEYNGMRWQINKDGELTVTFKSKTDDKGVPQDETSGGTFVKMDKEGSIQMDTALEGDEATNMKLDKPKKDILGNAGNNVAFNAKKNIELNADVNINGNAMVDINYIAEGKALYSAKSLLTLKSESQIVISGASLSSETSGLSSMKSSNMQIEAKASVDVKAPAIRLGDATANAVLKSTIYIGTGNLGFPVISVSVGPFSNNVFI